MTTRSRTGGYSGPWDFLVAEEDKVPQGMRISLKFLVLSLLLGAPIGAGGPSAPERLVIASVATEGGVLVIRGEGFGHHLAPQITLGGVGLTGVTRVSDQEARAPIPPGTAAGTYPLKVARNPGRFAFDSIDVTIGASGPRGPAGPKGDKGDPGLPGAPGLGLETGQIRGQLVACTPRSFDGALVYVPGRSFSATTGTGGAFELSYLPPGTYDVVAAQAGTRLVTVPAIGVSSTLASDLGPIQTTKLDSDRANCGACGNACGATDGCVGGLCVCAPTTCAANSWNCGNPPDGCGGTLSCGTCTGSNTCGGGDVPNRCGHEPTDPCQFKTTPGKDLPAICP